MVSSGCAGGEDAFVARGIEGLVKDSDGFLYHHYMNGAMFWEKQKEGEEDYMTSVAIELYDYKGKVGRISGRYV